MSVALLEPSVQPRTDPQNHLLAEEHLVEGLQEELVSAEVHRTALEGDANQLEVQTEIHLCPQRRSENPVLSEMHLN